MELYKEILVKVLKEQIISVTFPNLTISTKEIIELECYKALQTIKTIIQDDSIDDKECFAKIEKIICVFEKVGSDGGNRHDFG